MSVKTILNFNVIIIQSSKFDIQINYAVLIKENPSGTNNQTIISKKKGGLNLDRLFHFFCTFRL